MSLCVSGPQDSFRSFPQRRTDYYYYATAGGARIWVSRHDCLLAGVTIDSCLLLSLLCSGRST
jgi:hypothetical protein